MLPACPRRFASLNPTFHPDAFGFALPTSGGRPAAHAYVFFHHVEQAAMKTRNGSEAVSTASLLAHVVAHEIGHLLLGPNMHSSLGIMRPRWKAGDFREMEIGQMVFPPEQVKMMQSRLRDRTASPIE